MATGYYGKSVSMSFSRSLIVPLLAGSTAVRLAHTLQKMYIIYGGHAKEHAEI